MTRVLAVIDRVKGNPGLLDSCESCNVLGVLTVIIELSNV